MGKTMRKNKKIEIPSKVRFYAIENGTSIAPPTTNKYTLIMWNALDELNLRVLEGPYCNKYGKCWGNLDINERLLDLDLEEGECIKNSTIVEFDEREYKVSIRICRYKDIWYLPPYRCYFNAKISEIES